MEAPPCRLLWALCSPTFPFASQGNGRERLTCGPSMRPRLSCSAHWKRHRVCRAGYLIFLFFFILNKQIHASKLCQIFIHKT